MNGCWEWTGTRDNRGYGVFRSGAKTRKAHRVAFEMALGPIPDGLFVCHRCDNPPCIRPDHLFVGTPADNAHDRDTKGRTIGHYSLATHCRNGHPFDDANTRRTSDRRACRACNREAVRRYRARLEVFG